MLIDAGGCCCRTAKWLLYHMDVFEMMGPGIFFIPYGGRSQESGSTVTNYAVLLGDWAFDINNAIILLNYYSLKNSAPELAICCTVVCLLKIRGLSIEMPVFGTLGFVQSVLASWIICVLPLFCNCRRDFLRLGPNCALKGDAEPCRQNRSSLSRHSPKSARFEICAADFSFTRHSPHKLKEIAHDP